MPTTTQASEAAAKSINANFAKKNRPPSAGKGRKKGQLNVVSKTTREFIHEFLAFNMSKVQEDYDKLRKIDVGKALQVYANLLEYDIPKLARTETIHSGDPLVSLTPISDPAEAAATYQSLLGNTKFDLTVIKFAPPHQSPVVAEQGPRPDNIIEFKK
jgi:hypothetical protein